MAWFAEKEGSPKARDLATSGHTLLAPAFLLLEIGNALARKATKGLVPAGFAGQVLRLVRQRQALRIVPTEPLIEHAASLAEELPHPIYDCLYLALSQREGARLATFDEDLSRHARSLRIPLWTASDTA